MTATGGSIEIERQLLAAVRSHVRFDGWSETAFRAAATDCGVERELAYTVCPRGAVDLAVAFHRAGDDAMADAIGQTDLSRMKFRDRISHAIRLRLEAAHDREAVRRSMALFALPHNVVEGAMLIWRTADRIWTVLGDDSDDFNWYTKRVTLAAVYSATTLYWLGDSSRDSQASWEFLERRIDDAMRFGKFRAAASGNRLLKPFLTGPSWLLPRIKAPPGDRGSELPGALNRER